MVPIAIFSVLACLIEYHNLGTLPRGQMNIKAARSKRADSRLTIQRLPDVSQEQIVAH